MSFFHSRLTHSLTHTLSTQRHSVLKTVVVPVAQYLDLLISLCSLLPASPVSSLCRNSPCDVYFSYTVWLLMITKTKFSSEISNVVSPSLWLCNQRARKTDVVVVVAAGGFTGIVIIIFKFPRNFLSHYPLCFTCAVPSIPPSLQAVLISPLALAEQVGQVWHSPLTCSQG